MTMLTVRGITQEDLLQAEEAWQRKARAARRKSDLWIGAGLVACVLVAGTAACLLCALFRQMGE